MKTEENLEELKNSIFLGEVRSVHNYGAFVNIPGQHANGLIHKSQISKCAVDDATEVLQQGERVWCKVIGITDENKISLSMKVVDQGSGKDLDPNGVQIQQDQLKRKSFDPSQRKRVIELEAVLKTTCTKCGTYGHIARDCFMTPGGKKYELLPDEDESIPDVQSQLLEESEKIKHKKMKKVKKHKKDKKQHKKSKKSKKERKYSPESSTTDDMDTERMKHKKSKGHQSEKLQRKRSHSASPESSYKRKRQH